MGWGLCYLFDVGWGNLDHGTAEEVDLDAYIGGCGVFDADDTAFEPAELASDDAYMIAEGDRFGRDADGTLGLIEHITEGLHLDIGDGGYGFLSKGIGGAGTVDEERLDIG